MPKGLPLWMDRALYKKQNEIGRIFRRRKGSRRSFPRFEKLDVVFLAFLNFALIAEARRSCERDLIAHHRFFHFSRKFCL